MPAIARRQSKSDRTREQILAIAERLFAERGFFETRLEDVGEEMGAGRSTVLYHFKDKRQLYQAVLSEVFGGLLIEIRAAFSRSGTLPERVESAVESFVDYIANRPSAARIALRESVTTDEAILREIHTQASPFLVLLDVLFDEGERSGVIRANRSDSLHFASMIGGATIFYVGALPTFVPNLTYDPLSHERLARHKRDVIRVARQLLGFSGPQRVLA